MSASREKRTRKEAPAKPVAKQEPAKKGMPKAVKWIIGIIVTLAALALLGISVVFGSTHFHANSTALTVGEHEISPAEFNYFYREAYYQMAQQYGDSSSYLSYMTDMIVEQAVSNVKDTYAVYDAAVAEGYTLTEEEIAELDQELQELTETASSMGGSADALLTLAANSADMALIVTGHHPAAIRGAEKTGLLLDSRGVPGQKLVLNRFDTDAVMEGRRPGINTIIDMTRTPILGVIPEDHGLELGQEAGKLYTESAEKNTARAIENLAARLCGESVPLFAGLRRLRRRRLVER